MMPPAIEVVEPITHYSAERLPRTHVPPQRGYDAYRECLRLDFFFRCIYCGSHESEVAPGDENGGFEIEHFKPQADPRFQELKNSYHNLLWACSACNGAKGETWPNREEQDLGFIFLDPTEMPLADHLVIVGLKVQARTRAGEYVRDEINLNSELHQHRRESRVEHWTKIMRIKAAIEVKKREGGDQDRLDELLCELAEVEEQLSPGAPWDAPTWCRCDKPRAPRRSTKKHRRWLRTQQRGEE